LQDRFGDTDAILVVQKPFAHVELIQAAHTLTSKWLLDRAVRAQIGELEAAVFARTAQLEAANARLAEQLVWRDRVETEVRVSQRLEAIGQLAAGIAHEINNPLQYVGDHLEFVHDSTGDLLSVVTQLAGCADRSDLVLAGEARCILESIDVAYLARELPGALEAIQGGIRRITSIVRAMKELAHPGTRDPGIADINRALESALEISANSYRGVAELDKQLQPLPPVTCYVAELGQVFLNLIVNAAHAMEDRGHGTLKVSSAVDGEHVVVAIGDTGGGIPPEIQSRIFDPFFTTKAVGRGTGQGLAIARAIVVDHHGGSLSFDSVTDQGTTFVIRIPISGPTPRQATIAA
jgi:signal transduction histidine kinase